MAVDWTNFIGLIGIPAAVGVYGLVHGQFKARDERIDGIDGKVAVLAKTFYDYKVEVSDKYATTAYLRDVENRITQRFDAIDKKLDRLIERNQRRDTDP